MPEQVVNCMGWEQQHATSSFRSKRSQHEAQLDDFHLDKKHLAENIAPIGRVNNFVFDSGTIICNIMAES